MVLITALQPAFAASDHLRNIPLLKTLINSLDSVYIPRGGSDEKKRKCLEIICERQDQIEKSGWRSPFLIFAEGGCTNGTGLMNFKKGGFVAEKAVRPVFIKYTSRVLSPSYEAIPLLPLAILMTSYTGLIKCEIHILPDFKPN